MKQVSCGDKIVELGSSADRHQAVTRHLRGSGVGELTEVTPSERRDMSSIDLSLIVICLGL